MPGYKLPAEEDRRRKREKKRWWWWNAGNTFTFVCLVSKAGETSIYLASHPQWQKKLAKDVTTGVLVFQREDWTVWRLLIALYCQDWANASFWSSCTAQHRGLPTKALSTYRIAFYASSKRDHCFSQNLQMVFGRKDRIWIIDAVPFTNLELAR